MIEPSLIDTAFLDEQTFGSPNLRAELLALFIEQASKLRPWLADATVGVADQGAVLHRLKGSARAIGATLLADAAERAEEAVRSAETGRSAALDTLLTSLDATCTFAASLLSANRTGGLAKRGESR